ncbi:hypothetical protein ALQ01_05585 [Pseudomonas savastanoi pv. glycinea]|nr:hypothetical protein ALQ01_05585 [Pseudomonas savastanoi pv. glycinea]RMT05616.1 hypothetical protein ALP53_05707 [Pseudomonas savastanoi pv. phaseolicola]
MPGQVHDAEQQIADFLGNAFGVIVDHGFKNFIEFFTHLVDHWQRCRPVEADLRSTLLQFGGTTQRRQGHRHVIEQRQLLGRARLFGTLLGLDLVPTLVDLLVGQARRFCRRVQLAGRKHVRMATQQLAGNTVDDVVEFKPAFLFGQLRIEDHLKQQVTQLTLQMVEVALLDGIGHFVGFFQRMRHDAGVGLLQVPRATRLRITQPGHEVQQVLNCIHGAPCERRQRLWRPVPARFDNVRQLGNTPQQPPQCVQARNLDGQRHERCVVFLVRAGVDRQYVDTLVEQHLGDVTQQAGTVVGANDDVHRIREHRHRPPADLNDPLGLATTQLQHRSAILTVNADATPLGDVTDNRIARQRLAATGHLCHQVANALNLNIATLARLIARSFARDQFQLFINAIRFNLLLSQIDQLRQTQITRAQGGKHVVGGLVVGLVRQLVEVDLRQCQARQFAFDKGFTGRNVLVAGLQFEPVNNLGARPRGRDVTEVGVQPVTARRAVLAGDDLDLLAGLQAVVERYDAAVDLRTTAVMADFGVHPIGKVQRCCALGQVDGVTVRGEDVDAVRLDIDSQLVCQAADVAQLFMPFEHLTQPGNLLFVMIGAGFDVGAFIAPMRTNAQLGLFMHGVGADLHFQHLAFRPDNGGVQRAIAVFLGVGDVIVELFGNMPPQGVHNAQRGIAIAHFRDQYTQRAHVIDLAECQAFALHFAPDGIDMFGSATDVSRHAGGLQFVVELGHDVADEALAVQPALVQQLGDLLVLIRLQVAERQVFQLPLDMPDTQTMGQRCIDVEDFASHTIAFFVVGVLHRTNRAGTFGQFDQRNTNVVDHRHQHLAQVFDLRLTAEYQRLTRAEAGADRGHAQHAVDQFGDRRAKTLLDLRQRDDTFTHAAVNDRRNQRVLIQLEISQDLRDFQTGLETGGALCPVILVGLVVLLGLPGKLTGLFHDFPVQDQVDADNMIEPRVEIDTAVCVYRLVRSHLYHAAYLPYGAMNSAISRQPSERMPLAGQARTGIRGPVGLNEVPCQQRPRSSERRSLTHFK